MASAVIEEELSCPVCQDIYKDPVLLSCSHSFCRECLEKWWRLKDTRECPVCKTTSDRKQPTSNLVLKNTCEAFLLERERQTSAEVDPLCRRHSEKLKLFCLDHNELVCLICRDSDVHRNHRFRPSNEVSRDRKEELQKSLTPLQDKLGVFKRVREKYEETAEYLQVQVRHAEAEIQYEFKRMYHFLQKEEATRIAALKEEERSKRLMVKEKTDNLDTKISALADAIKATETEMTCNDVTFLQNYEAAVERVQSYSLHPDPQPIPGALINEAKHLGNLGFSVWRGMKGLVSHTPVVLDPNTAEAGLILSSNLTRVSRGEKWKVPDNPERFECHGVVMASEGYVEGIHSWVVEVGDNTAWFVGVATETFQRKGRVNIRSGLWAVAFSKGNYSIISHQSPTIYHPKRKLWTIRVQLDLEKGSLTFSDPITRTNIHSFSHSWTERLFPVFYTGSEIPLQILPVVLRNDGPYDDSDNDWDEGDDRDRNGTSDKQHQQAE
ncbi:E3 ubiquitin-protein ligase TRIM35 [Nothobranchius furzeri]|uniref:Tripartite motif containing 35 n=3 Tax=Nothobranchius TaxID=28779 RepID=A0A1A8B2U9_NOTFU|nr:E3 ubiquitin-protein ligase TRIM35 [Nothobranchius furzeri]XP_054587338.1 E3 ubiquitin-protein ligase TRIM35 [Nothobranchius furzeri]KAF7207721.1 tripartite motif-containing protein 35-like [Nothobranchius furzeri]